MNAIGFVRHRTLCLVVVLCLPCHSGIAGMSPDELMDPITDGMTEEERKARREAIERDRLAAEERRRAIEEAARAEREAREAERASRPYPERLTEQRCTPCHSTADFKHQARTWTGWAFTVWRMRLAHGADLEPGEWRVITAYLAKTQGASGARTAGVRTAIVAIPAILAASIWILTRRRRRKP